MRTFSPSEFDTQDWLSTLEAAIYIRSFKKDGKTPCTTRIRNLVGQRRLTPYKPFGRLLFSRTELKKIIETSRLG